MEARNFRLRVTFCKKDRLSYLSHLEVTHALERMIRRSGLPYAITEGFSPHMKISFGSALGVGVGSTCEIFDLTLKEYMAPSKVLKALKSSSDESLSPIEAKYIDQKSASASSAFPYSLYVAKFDEPVPDFEIPETIRVIRKKKEKELEVDKYLVDVPVIDDDRLFFQLHSGNFGNLRPDIFIEHCGLPRRSSLMRICQSDEPIDIDSFI